MTCIVGVADERGVWIGGDSAGVSGWLSHVRADTKVFERGPFIMGFTTSFRMGQLLRHALDVPQQPPNQPIDEFLATTFVDAVRKCLKDGGMAKKESDVESGGTFLLGYHGSLYRVGNDYQIAETIDGVDAVGAGNELALGALWATAADEPTDRITTALEAAAHYSAAVRGPFTVVHQSVSSKGRGT